MNTNPEQTNGREEIAARAFDKWRRRERANHVQDWLDAETEVLQLRELTRRVTELEGQIRAGKKTNLNHQLVDAIARRAATRRRPISRP